MYSRTFLIVLVAICLLTGSAWAADKRAPEQFLVNFNTTQGLVKIQVVRQWAPLGVDRFYTLLTQNYYDNNAFFRVIQSPSPFVAQWGISSDPSVNQKWENAEIPNDPVVKSNTRGFITYAAEMPNGNSTCCRTTQIYVNYADNSRLDQYGFAPFAQVLSGMEYLDKLYSGYGEGVDQDKIYKYGSQYLQKFPKLDYLISATILSQKSPSSSKH